MGVIYEADFSAMTSLVSHTTSSPITSTGGVAGPNFSVNWSEIPATDSVPSSVSTNGSSLVILDWGGRISFQTGSIDVSGWNTVDITVTSSQSGFTSSEFSTWFYQLDSDSFVIGSSITGSSGDLSFSVNGLDVSSKSTLQFIADTDFNGASDTFTISQVTVTGVSAIPEPGTYAAIGGLLALGLVLLRRRKP